jgi:hypothetical protein
MTKYAELERRAKEMRHAIDMMEGAMMGWDELMDLPENCSLDNSDNPELELEVKITWKHLQRVLGALSECTRIINLEEYVIRSDGEQLPGDKK